MSGTVYKNRLWTNCSITTTQMQLQIFPTHRNVKNLEFLQLSQVAYISTHMETLRLLMSHSNGIGGHVSLWSYTQKVTHNFSSDFFQYYVFFLTLTSMGKKQQKVPYRLHAAGTKHHNVLWNYNMYVQYVQFIFITYMTL